MLLVMSYDRSMHTAGPLQFVIRIASDDIVLKHVGQVDVESHESVDHRQEDVVTEPFGLHQDVEEEALEAEHEPGMERRNFLSDAGRKVFTFMLILSQQ